MMCTFAVVASQYSCLFHVQVTNLHLQGQLTECHRVEEVNRKELEAARLQKFAADTEMNKAEAEMKRAKAETKLADQRNFEAYNQIDSLRKQAGDSKRQMNELEVCACRCMT